MDKQIRDKYLTEAMLPALKGAKHIPYKFSTWEGFGKLWEWSQKQEWFPELIRQTCYYEMCRNEFSKGHDSIIHPDRFADAVYCYLAE